MEVLLEEKMPLWLAQTHVPAVGVAIIENGKLKVARVFGELRNGVPAPVDTLFEVASLTKPIVTMLALKLVNEGNSSTKWSGPRWQCPEQEVDPQPSAWAGR